MIRATDVKALPNYKIWIKYADGTQGEVDLSEYTGKGIFKKWDDYSFFEKVSIGSSGEIKWDTNIDLCPDSIYMKLTNLSPEDLFPSLINEEVNA